MTGGSSEVLEAGHVEVQLDTGKCRAYGVCVGLAPDVFELPKGSPVAVLRRSVADEADLEDLQEAVFSCPAQAITLTARTAPQ